MPHDDVAERNARWHAAVEGRYLLMVEACIASDFYNGGARDDLWGVLSLYGHE